MNYRFSINSEHGKLIAYWQDLAGYYRDDTGCVWSYSFCTHTWSNAGELTNEELKKRYRITEFISEAAK